MYERMGFRFPVCVKRHHPSIINFIVSAYKKKKAFHLSVNVLSSKVLIGDTIFTSSTGDRTAILRGQPSHAKV